MSLKLSMLQRNFTVFLLILSFLGACAPATRAHPTPLATSTPKVATFTPFPTITSAATETPKLPLPVVKIPFTPTPGDRAITAKNIENLETLDMFGNGKVQGTKWSPNAHFLALDTSLGWQIYHAETFQRLNFPGDIYTGDLEWSPNGKFLATLEEYYGDEMEPVRLHDGETLEQIKVLRKAEYFTWSPSGNRLAIIDSAHIYLYDPDSAKQISTISTTEYPGAVRFSPDEKTIATFYTGDVRLWDATTGKLVLTIKDIADVNHYIARFEFNPDGEDLLVLEMESDFDYKVSLLNVATGKIVYTNQAFLEYSRAVNARFSPDGQQMVLQAYKTLSFVDVHSGRVLKTISLQYDDSIAGWFTLAYSRDGKKLITTAGIFDVQTGERLDRLAFANFESGPQGRLLAAIPYNNDPPSILLWDVEKNQKIRSIPGVDINLYPVSISPDEKKILTFDVLGNVLIDEIATGRQLAKIEFDTRATSVAFGPKTSFSSGYLLAIGQESGKIQVWDTGKHRIIHTFFADPGARMANPVAISPNGQLLAYHGFGGGFEIVDIFSGKVLRNLALDNDWINHLVFSPDGQMLIAGSESPRRLFWGDIDHGDSLVRADAGKSYNFDFSLNGNQLIWTDNSPIYLWDMTTKKLSLTLTKENPTEYEDYSVAALSTDGRLLVAGTFTGLIDIWDVEKGQILRTLTSDQHRQGYDGGADDTVKRLVFSPYNHVFVSYGADDSLRVWDADTGALLPFGGVGPFAFSPDGSMLASGYYEVILDGFPTAPK